MKHKKILYVVGSPRSGSTLIYNSLCSDRKTNPPLPESHFVDKVALIYAYQFNRFNIEKNYLFNDDEDLANYLNECMKKFFDKIGKKHNTNILILKSIVCSQNAHIIHRLFPNISFVFCVRDPRDIAYSMIKIGEEQKKRKIIQQYPREIEKLCKRINDSYRVLFEKKLSNKFFNSLSIIKYEDFINDPSNVLNNISKHLSLNIKYKKTIPVWERGKELYSNEKYGYRSNLWNKPISNNNIGSFKNNLTSKEILKINKLCSKLMSRFNYKV